MKKTRKSSVIEDRRTPSVHVELIEPNAIDVCIAGTFNEWKADATPMVRLGDGRWAKELSLPAGCYEYRFVVDGAWVNDPKAKETVPNPFGTSNSVLRV